MGSAPNGAAVQMQNAIPPGCCRRSAEGGGGGTQLRKKSCPRCGQQNNRHCLYLFLATLAGHAGSGTALNLFTLRPPIGEKISAHPRPSRRRPRSRRAVERATNSETKSLDDRLADRGVHEDPRLLLA